MAQSFANALYAGSQYALVAVALSLAYSVARFLNFALGAIYAVAAYSTYWFVHAGLPILPAACAGILVAGLVGGAFELIVFGQLRQQGATPLVALIAALGVFVVVQGMLSICFGTSVKMIRSPSVVAGLDIFGARLTRIQLVGTIASFFLCVATWIALRHSEFGRHVRAVACDSSLAKAVGVDTKRVYLWTTALCSVLVGFAGIVGAYDVDLRPTMGFSPLLMGVVAMLVGGVGQPLGAWLAALFIAGIQEVAVVMLPTQWQYTIVFVVLIVFLIVRTEGSSDRFLKHAQI